MSVPDIVVDGIWLLISVAGIYRHLSAWAVARADLQAVLEAGRNGVFRRTAEQGIRAELYRLAIQVAIMLMAVGGLLDEPAQPAVSMLGIVASLLIVSHSVDAAHYRDEISGMEGNGHAD